MPPRPFACAERCSATLRHASTAASSRKNDKDNIFPFSVRLSNRSTIDLFQMRAKLGGDIEIIFAAVRPHFKDDGDHDAEPRYSTRRRKVRSSARMKRSFSANWKVARHSGSACKRARYAS